MTKNILVTGAGALLGQGILRLLQIADFSKKIFTSCLREKLLIKSLSF